MLLRWSCSGVRVSASAVDVAVDVTERAPQPLPATPNPSRIRIAISRPSNGSVAATAVAPTRSSVATSARALGFPLPPTLTPSPELGLLSLVFVLSTAIGAIFSLAIISIPAMNAFRKLEASMNRLSKVVSEEVPGTLSSLKLSALEINHLTQQLSNLRQKFSPSRFANRRRSNKSTSSSKKNYTPDM